MAKATKPADAQAPAKEADVPATPKLRVLKEITVPVEAQGGTKRRLRFAEGDVCENVDPALATMLIEGEFAEYVKE